MKYRLFRVYLCHIFKSASLTFNILLPSSIYMYIDTTTKWTYRHINFINTVEHLHSLISKCHCSAKYIYFEWYILYWIAGMLWAPISLHTITEFTFIIVKLIIDGTSSIVHLIGIRVASMLSASVEIQAENWILSRILLISYLIIKLI